MGFCVVLCNFLFVYSCHATVPAEQGGNTGAQLLPSPRFQAVSGDAAGAAARAPHRVSATGGENERWRRDPAAPCPDGPASQASSAASDIAVFPSMCLSII